MCCSGNFCRTFGAGEPLLVIHGGPGLSQDYLLPYMSELAKTNFVIFYDQRGCGQSFVEINEETIQIEKFLEDIESIRKFFGFSKLTVIGHSWGGFLAMQYATTYPHMTEKLILMNSMPASSNEASLFFQEYFKRMTPFQAELAAIKETDAFKNGEPEAHRKYYQIVFGRYCYIPEKALMLNLEMSLKASLNGAIVNEIFREQLLTKEFNLHAKLQKLSVPTLIIHGDADIIPYHTAEKMHESISGSEYILMKNCGHFPYVESPQEFFSYIDAFIKKN